MNHLTLLHNIGLYGVQVQHIDVMRLTFLVTEMPCSHIYTFLWRESLCSTHVECNLSCIHNGSYLHTNGKMYRLCDRFIICCQC